MNLNFISEDERPLEIHQILGAERNDSDSEEESSESDSSTDNDPNNDSDQGSDQGWAPPAVILRISEIHRSHNNFC